MTHIEKLRKEFNLLCDVTDKAFGDRMLTRDGMVAVLLQLDGVYNALRVVEEADAMWNTPLWECFHALENIVESNPGTAGDRARAALLAMWRQQGNEDVDMPESTCGSIESHE